MQEYTQKLKAHLGQSSFDFEEEKDLNSNIVGFIHDGNGIFTVSYETDDIAPYLAIGRMILKEDVAINHRLSNTINDTFILVKCVANEEFGTMIYSSMPFPFIKDIDSFIGLSIDAVNAACNEFVNEAAKVK